ncbi:hypothetical protein L7F22_026817 [Adiantum nelumboides]|nr:hypothetical protein [Adiantum nelumboides]
MPSHSEPDLSVRALLRNLNEELDRKKVQNISKAQGSLRYRLGSRVNEQDLQITRGRSGGELYGAIFMCNRRTWKECLGQCLFGLPIGKKSLVEKVVPGMKLFLFEYVHRQLWGIFEAISYGGMDIIPDAYTGGSFPCQVRVNVPEDCVALHEEEFYNALKDNYFSAEKFHFDLNRRQVCHLTSLFERKYLRAKGMQPCLLEYENRWGLKETYDQTGPLLLTNEKAGAYAEDRNITSGSHNLYASECQILEDGSYLNSGEGVGFVYKNIENFTSTFGHRAMEISPMVPFSNGIVQDNCLPMNVDISRFTNIGGQLGGSGTGDLIPVYSKQETIETVIIPGHVSRLHCDRPNGKSVWSRISGRARPLMTAEILQKQGKVSPSSVHLLSAKVPDESVVEEINYSPVHCDCKTDMTLETAEEFSIGFKRRRAININASANASEMQASKRRKKLMRPVFEASADEPSVKSTDCQPTRIDLNIPLESLEDFMPLDLENDYQKKEQEPCALAQEGCTIADHQNQQCMELSLAEMRQQKLCALVQEGFMIAAYQDQQCMDGCLGEMRQQEPCALALSLCTQATDLILPQIEKKVALTSSKQNSPEASALVEADIQKRMFESDDLLENCVTVSKQVDKADGEHAKLGSDILVIREHSFDLLPHTTADCPSLESIAADGSRAYTLSLAPCTPAKEAVGSSGPAVSTREEGLGLSIMSRDLMQEIPLKLDARLPNVETQLENKLTSEQASDGPVKGEICNEATVSDTLNALSSKQSELISLDAGTESSLLNSVDLKSLIGTLRVSGIKLQLGSSPCLVFQLGESSSSVTNHDQEEAVQTYLESGLTEPSSDDILLQRLPSS